MKTPLPVCLFLVCAATLLGLFGQTRPAFADAPDEVRALWVQAWVADLHSPSGIDKVIADARSANVNTLFVQMRRRGDTLYFSDIEPRISSGVPGFSTFDPLTYILNKAREQNPPIEIHAWIVVYPVDRATSDPQHVTNAHPEWMTQDINGVIDQTLDPGHPGVQQHLLDVAMELVTKYDIDGLHYDYIRYYGNQFGYNPVAVQRFQALYNRNDFPSPNDPEWSDFRRNQVTQLVRSIYLNAIDARPEVKISASTITWSPGPANINDFPSTRPYYDILSNWPAWMEEGILDLNVPMAYFRDFNSVQKADYTKWNNFIKDTRFNRHAAIGPGIYLNTLSGAIAQMRESRDLSPAGNKADGVSGYVYHETNNEGLPFSEFRRAVTQPSEYDPVTPPMFAEPAAIPDMPWKSNPTTGHIKGHVTDAATGKPIDGARARLSGPVNRLIDSDPLGFYGFVDLPPGEYQVSVSWDGAETGASPVTVTIGEVATLDIDFGAEPGPDEGQLQGYLRNAVNDQPIAGATVHLSNSSNRTTQTAHDGFYRFLQITPGPHTVRASWEGAPEDTPSTMVQIPGGEVTSQDLYFVAGGEPAAEIILDSDTHEGAGVTLTGPDWRASVGAAGNDGNYRWTHNPNHDAYAGPHAARFTPNLPAAGFYQIDTWYPQGGNRTPNAHYTISDGTGESIVFVNQQVAGSQWVNLVDSIYLNPGDSPFVEIKNIGNPIVVMADAVRWSLLEPVAVEFSITASVEGQGSIDGVPPGGKAAFGDLIELEAIGEGGFVFSRWDGPNGWGIENPLAIEVGTHLEIRAVFVSPWNDWLENVFTEQERGDPEFIAPNADPYGHGISNLLKFAFGLDVHQPDRSLLPQAVADDDSVLLTFRRRIGESGLDYRIEYSNDLVIWESASANIEQVSAGDNGDGTETVIVRVSANGGPRLFVKLAVAQD